jgi:hypothetical protein
VGFIGDKYAELAAAMSRAAAQDSAAYLEPGLAARALTSMPGLERVTAAASASMTQLPRLADVGASPAKRAPPVYRRSGGSVGSGAQHLLPPQHQPPHSPITLSPASGVPSGFPALASALPPAAASPWPGSGSSAGFGLGGSGGAPRSDGFLLDPVFSSQGGMGLAVARRFAGSTNSGVVLRAEAEHVSRQQQFMEQQQLKAASGRRGRK